jgi:hypothetical protein
MSNVPTYPRLQGLQATDILYAIRETDYHTTVEDVFTEIQVPVDAESGLNLSGAVQTINNSGVISATTNMTFLETDADATYTIADGVNLGQIKLVSMRVFGGTGTLSSNIRGQSIVWSGVNQTVILYWDGSNWIPLAGTATITPLKIVCADY